MSEVSTIGLDIAKSLPIAGRMRFDDHSADR
jgi:hypothetical protein